MAGELKYTALNTVSIQTADRRLAQAFSEGRTGLVAGANTNPHVSGSELHTAYEAGYATSTPEGTIDNCALAIPITVPDIVTMDQATAEAAIVAVKLVVGKITGGFGTVTVQLPAAAAKAQPGAVVTFTQKVVVPNIVGMTSANAVIALVAAHLIAGTVTGTTGVVSVQNPAAAALALSGAAVAYTIA